MKKIFIFAGLAFLVIFILLGYNLTKPQLTLYPKYQEDNVELHLLKEQFNFDIANDLIDGDIPFTNITITDGQKSVHRIIAIEKMDLGQKDCPQKWDCPLIIVPKETFIEIFDKKVRDPFDADITKEVSNRNSI